MRDSDIDSLSADGAQDTARMTDPRAALAEAYADVMMKRGRGSDIPPHVWREMVDLAAERGVLLVSKADVEAAMVKADIGLGVIHGNEPLGDYYERWSAEIFAALSGEAES